MTEHTPAKPAEEPKELAPGPYGTFLKEHGIASTRLPDHLGNAGTIEVIEVAKKDLEQAVKRLRNSSETNFDYLVCLSGVDSDTTYDTVYHLWSYAHTKEMVIKVKLPKNELDSEKMPHVTSLTPFWPAANWHERETYDLVGVRFIGHPYMRRILNPWDWDGHPLRKEYKQPIDALNDKNPLSMR